MMWVAFLLFLTMNATAQARDATAPAIAAGTVQTVTKGNMPPGFYPKSPCIKPDSQSIGRQPGDRRDGRAVETFNQQIRAYNKVAQAYNACVQDYAAQAQIDIQEIRAAINAANQ